MRIYRHILLLSILLLGSSSLFAAHEGKFCEKNYSSYGDKVSAKDLRESTMPATSLLTVDGRKNGGISVSGENRSDILIRACIRAWGDTQQEADSAAKGTRITTGSVVKAENPNEKAKYSVSYQILVPRSTNLKLMANNGGISIGSVEGNIGFETRNGGVSLKDVGGSVKGTTRNGGVSVGLSGNRFNGSGLDVETRNGGISLMLPANYSADVETGTVNGGLRSDFKELQVEKKGRGYQRNKKVSASINGGGPKIRLVTTNGGVRIKTKESPKP